MPFSNMSLEHVLLPADHDKHALYLVGGLIVLGLLVGLVVACCVAVNLVASADQGNDHC